MNCKPGDLAVVTRGRDCGTFVVCKEVAFNRTWSVDRDLLWSDGNNDIRLPYCPDEFLRPIRDQPGTDEIIRIADVIGAEWRGLSK